MKLYIKYMVSNRCRTLVKEELDKNGIKYGMLELGEVEVIGSITAEQRRDLKRDLSKSGFELLDDKKAVLLEKIISVIVEMIYYADELPQETISDYLDKKLNSDYKYLSALFSETKGITIEHFITLHKIERVKELLIYDEFKLSEISDKLNFKNVTHLSKQMKKYTGLMPTFFKQIKSKRLNTI